MKKFLKDLFSDSNEINENTVMGVIFVGALLVAAFIPDVGDERLYVFGGLVAAFFGIGALKR